MKLKRKKRDERVNVRYTWVKDFIGLFLILIVINSGHILIFMEIFNIEPTVSNLLVPDLMAYLIFATLILCTITTMFRSSSLNLPMQRLSEAAKRIAEGDFFVRVAPLRKDGKKDYVEVMFDDFNKMAEELSSIETLKNDFITNVSHEIKTPLSVIQSYAAAIQRDTLSPEKREEYAETILTASHKLTALVTNILKLSKLENQGITPAAEPFDLSEQLRCCALAFEDLWENKGIAFTADIADDVTVSYDESMLEIVWNNLLSNAIKFTDPGGSIALTLKSEDGFAVVSVTDNGCGMDEVTRSRIFDKFYQGDTSHSQEGNGLGLALVKKVIDIIDGGITVDSKVGLGTTLTIRLKKV